MVYLKNDDDIIKCDDKLIFNPFNPINKDVTLNDVQSILKKYGLPFPVHNLDLYKLILLN